jgi:hypothetical protein
LFAQHRFAYLPAVPHLGIAVYANGFDVECPSIPAVGQPSNENRVTAGAFELGKQEHVALHLHEGGFGLGTPPPCATVCGQRYKERQHGDNHARHWRVGFQCVDDVPQ